VECRFLLNIVVGESSSVLELLAGEDETLLVWGNSLLILNLGLHVFNGIGRFHFKSDGLTSESLHEDLHASTKSEDQVKSALLLDVVVGEGASVLELFAGEDETLLIWGNSLLVLDLSFHVLNGIRRFDFKGDGLASQGLYKDLHASTKTEDQVESALLLDVVVGESATILELLAGEDETLLIWGNSLLVLDLGLYVLNRVAGFHFKGDGLASESLDEDLHTSTKSEDQMESAFLLDVVVGESSSILELLAGENETLLIWGNSLLVLDFSLHVLNRVAGLHFKGDGFSGESFDEDLHTSTKSEDQVKGALFLDVVVGEGAAILELFASEDETLLIWGNSFLVLDLSLDVLNRIAWLDLEGDGFSGEGFDEDLHSTTKSQDQVKGALLLDVVVGEGASILKLLASKDETLLVWGNSFLVLDLGLDILN